MPDDDNLLRNIARCPTADWMRSKGNLAALFQIEGGLWKHKRIETELAEAEDEYRRQCERTKAATEARQRNDQRNVERNVSTPHNVTTNVTRSESESESESHSESEPEPNDKASGSTKPTKRLSGRQKEVADRIEEALDGDWINDAGKWIARVRIDARKVERVASEVCDAMKSGRVSTTPGAYAEDCWKRFA